MISSGVEHREARLATSETEFQTKEKQNGLRCYDRSWLAAARRRLIKKKRRRNSEFRLRRCAPGFSRLRQRYREALRTEVANTVSDPAEVDQRASLSLSDSDNMSAEPEILNRESAVIRGSRLSLERGRTDPLFRSSLNLPKAQPGLHRLYATMGGCKQLSAGLERYRV